MYVSKQHPTADQFDYTQPNFTYTKDTHVDISKYIKWKDDVTGHGKITKVNVLLKKEIKLHSQTAPQMQVLILLRLM